MRLIVATVLFVTFIAETALAQHYQRPEEFQSSLRAEVKYLVVLEFEQDIAGKSGKIRDKKLFEIHVDKSGNEVGRKMLDQNSRLKSGRSIEYRVTKINPFLFRAKGDNSTTAFTNDFSADELKLIKGTLSAALPAADSEASAKQASPDADNTKVPSDTYRLIGQNLFLFDSAQPVTGATKATETGTGALGGKNAQNIGYTDLERQEMQHHFSKERLKFTQGMTPTEKITFLDTREKEATKAIVSDAKTANTRKKLDFVRALVEKQYFDYRSEIVKLRGVERVALLDLPVLDVLDVRAAIQALQNTALKAADIGLLGAELVRISRNPSPSDPPEENIQTRAQLALARTTGTSKKDDVHLALGKDRDFATKYNDIKTKAADNSKKLGEQLKAIEETLASLEKERPAIITRKDMGVEKLLKDPNCVDIASIDDLLKFIVMQNERIDLIAFINELQVNTQKQGMIKPLITEAKSAQEKNRAMSDLADEIKKTYTAAYPQMLKGADLAVARYTEIENAKFETVAFSKVTEEGTVNFKLTLFRRNEDDSETLISDDYKLNFEVYDPRIIRMLDLSAAYVFAGPGKKQYFIDSSTNIQVRPRNYADTSLAVFVTVPLDPSSPSPTGLSFGINPTDQTYYLGLSKVFGSLQGATLSAGMALRKEDVLLNGFSVGGAPPTGATDVPTHSTYRTAFYFALGFKLKS